MNTVNERVERGAALLDEKRPGWWQDIDLGRLDISSSCDCIAGQQPGGYAGTMNALNVGAQRRGRIARLRGTGPRHSASRLRVRPDRGRGMRLPHGCLA